jgi:diguanylate cyclase (GGDEF)-like protein
MLIVGGILAPVTEIFAPPSQGSGWVVLALGAIAFAAGLVLFWIKRPTEPMLGGAAVIGTLVITASTHEAGLSGSGADDNEILYLWVCLYSFYFLRLPHALAQLAIVGVAYGALLIAQAPPETVGARWLTTVVTLLVAGLVVAKLRGSLQSSVEELARRARLDSLTGALNRRALTERAAVEFARAQREGTPISAIQIDVDRFKQLNDTLGHPVGDEVLKAVAKALASETRPVDAVARVGGDEFTILLPNTSASEADPIAERLRAAVEYDLDLAGTPAALSVGVATVEGPPTISFEQLWATADAAMYDAKRSGGDRVRSAPASGPVPVGHRVARI